MATPRQRRPYTSDRNRPLWLRVLTVAALLLISVTSTVQVCHAHGEPDGATASHGRIAVLAQSPADAPDSDGSSRQTQSSPEDHCPLCVAMHSALPATMHIAPEPLCADRAY